MMCLAYLSMDLLIIQFLLLQFKYPQMNTNQYQMQNNTPDAQLRQVALTFLPHQYRTSVKEDVRLSFAGDLNPLVQKDREFHFRSFVATIILIIGILVPIAIWIWFNEDFTEAIAIAFPIAGYVLYLLIGCICNDLHEYLRNIKQGEHFEDEYDRVRGLIGQFDFTCECYHYETKHHVRHHHQNGRSYSESYTTQEKVVTHRANQTIVPAQTADESGAVDRIRSENNIVFIHFIMNYRFFNDYSRNKVDELFHHFKCANNRDLFQNYNMLYNIPSLIEKMCFYVGDLGCNYNCWYYFFAIIGLLWPYSLWVQSKISRFDVSFMKVVTM